MFVSTVDVVNVVDGSAGDLLFKAEVSAEVATMITTSTKPFAATVCNLQVTYKKQVLLQSLVVTETSMKLSQF